MLYLEKMLLEHLRMIQMIIWVCIQMPFKTRLRNQPTSLQYILVIVQYACIIRNYNKRFQLNFVYTHWLICLILYSYFHSTTNKRLIAGLKYLCWNFFEADDPKWSNKKRKLFNFAVKVTPFTKVYHPKLHQWGKRLKLFRL
jgi:hypothetical protein